MKKLMLVDGNSMLFRAYYATAYGRPMSSASGIPTNAVYGFAMMLQKALELIQPDAALVAFDAGKHTFRHDLYPDYKGGRKPAPDDLVPQFALVRDYLDGYHIRWVEMQDIEADDLIGTMARHSEGYDTVIFTSDHDLLQLVDDETTVLLMKKGLTDMDEVTPDYMMREMGIKPLQIIDLKGLMGDHSDNIPGIPGIGEKTALKLLNEYGTVENVLANDMNIKGALGKKVQAGHESAMLSKKLATIRTDVELDFTADDCAFAPDYESLIRFFRSLDMNSLAAKYEQLLSDGGSVREESGEAPVQIVKTCPEGMLKNPLAVYLDATNDSFLTAEVHGFAIADSNTAVYMTVEDVRNDAQLCARLADSSAQTIGFDVKRNMHLLEQTGVEVCFSDDAMISAALANSTLTSQEKIFAAYDLRTTLSYEDVYGKTNRPKLPDPKEQASFSGENARNILKLFGASYPDLEKYSMVSLYRDVEMPLTEILYRMEKTGVICDVNVLADIAAGMKAQLDAEQKEIFSLTGHEFNINSPKQLSEVLYDELQLPGGKKRSTSAEVLEKLAGIHPVIEHLLVYRKLQKIWSTYAEGLQKYIFKDGRIHTLYNQCATQTGRLSSSEPNLQNISVRDEQGKIIRKAFLPGEGRVLISSDYHQIELRILAHMADEPGLIDAFRSNIDIHTKTAMDVFGVSEEEVTPLMRRRAKTVNFGIVYGISDFGLAEQLGITRREAAEFIASYYRSYPGIRTYMDTVVADCEKNGYVKTLLGRRREIPEIHDKNRMVREFGKRAAMNAPIQGTAADLIKLAMIRIDKAMKEAGVKSEMILQVHDELIFDVYEDEIEIMKKIIDEGMTGAMELKVPLTAECSVGSDWYEAK